MKIPKRTLTRGLMEGIVLKDKCVITGDITTGHDALLDSLGFHRSSENEKQLYVKVRLSPGDDKWWTNPCAWEFFVKQKETPEWFDRNKEKYIDEFKNIVVEWWREHVIADTKIKELSNGFYMLKQCEVEKLSGNVQTVLYDTVVHRVSDASIWEMSGNSVVEELSLDSIVHELLDDSVIRMMRDDSVVKRMLDHTVIQEMSGDSMVCEMWEGSTVDKMIRDSVVREMHNQSTIKEMTDRTIVRKLSDDSSVHTMHDNSTVQCMYGNGIVFEMYDESMVQVTVGHAVVKRMCDNATVRCMQGQSSIDVMENDSSVVKMQEASVIKITVDNAGPVRKADCAMVKHIIERKDLERTLKRLENENESIKRVSAF